MRWSEEINFLMMLLIPATARKSFKEKLYMGWELFEGKRWLKINLG
jgi:hypothetical protein